MYWVYILKSIQNGQLYIGFTDNLRQRYREHNLGLSKATRRFCPWELIYTEGFRSKDDALQREQALKHFGSAYSLLKRRIERSLDA